MQSIPHVVDVVVMRGVDASDDVTPSLLVELTHGATLAADYFATKDALNGPFPVQVEDFFFVNPVRSDTAPMICARLRLMVGPILVIDRCERLVDAHAGKNPPG